MKEGAHLQGRCTKGAVKKKKKRIISFALCVVFALLLSHLLEKVEKEKLKPSNEQHEGCGAG